MSPFDIYLFCLYLQIDSSDFERELFIWIKTIIAKKESVPPSLYYSDICAILTNLQKNTLILARKNMRACIVLEIVMYWNLSDLCVSASVFGAWLESIGKAWLCVRCRVFVWNSGSATRSIL